VLSRRRRRKSSKGRPEGTSPTTTTTTKEVLGNRRSPSLLLVLLDRRDPTMMVLLNRKDSLTKTTTKREEGSNPFSSWSNPKMEQTNEMGIWTSFRCRRKRCCCWRKRLDEAEVVGSELLGEEEEEVGKNESRSSKGEGISVS